MTTVLFYLLYSWVIAAAQKHHFRELTFRLGFSRRLEDSTISPYGFCIPVSHWGDQVELRWNETTEFIKCDSAVTCDQLPTSCEDFCIEILQKCGINDQPRKEQLDAFRCVWKELIDQCNPICFGSDSTTRVTCGQIVFENASEMPTMAPGALGTSQHSTTARSITPLASSNDTSQQRPDSKRLTGLFVIASVCGVGGLGASVMVYHWTQRGFPRMIQNPDPVASFLTNLPSEKRPGGLDHLDASLIDVTQHHNAHRDTKSFAGRQSSEAALLASTGLASGVVGAWLDRSNSFSSSSSSGWLPTSSMSCVESYAVSSHLSSHDESSPTSPYRISSPMRRLPPEVVSPPAGPTRSRNLIKGPTDIKLPKIE